MRPHTPSTGRPSAGRPFAGSAPTGRRASRKAVTPEPTDNHLLACLNAPARQRIFPKLKPVELPLGAVIDECGQEITHVFFPTDSIISLINVLADGASAEISVVGREGFAGLAAILGSRSTLSRSVVQSGGWAFRMRADDLHRDFLAQSDARSVILRYTQSLIAQIAQTAVCNRFHTVQQQLCRWLLLSLDRLPDNRLLMTQELIANMLGVRREAVTAAAGKLQRLGVMRYRRGLIVVTDRPVVEKLACECYHVLRKETYHLLPRLPITTTENRHEQ